jgi:hypothetical protein
MIFRVAAGYVVGLALAFVTAVAYLIWDAVRLERAERRLQQYVYSAEQP